MVVLLHRCFFNRLPFEELFLLLFFFVFVGAFRVELFHVYNLTGGN
jgi:hypothetical protein